MEAFHIISSSSDNSSKRCRSRSTDLPILPLLFHCRDVQHPVDTPHSVTTIAFDGGSGLLTRFPSTTPFGLALGADSPCSDERGAGNLGLAASGLFTRFIVTHVSIRTSDTSRQLLNCPSQAYGTLPYHSCLLQHKSAASVTGLAPLHLPRTKTRPVSYYAFFEGWLLLSQLPGCLGLCTSFST